MSDVTHLLEAAAADDRKAAADLLPLVYGELRKLAAARMSQESPGHTLNPTALVHEAFLKLGAERPFATKTDYLRAAAEAMRRILVDHARARNAAKRASGHRVDLESGHLVAAPQDDNLSALDDALSRLAREHPELAELVQLRYFGGLTLAECAEALGVSARTADTWWAYAKSWLAVELKRS
ncbi:MAG: RNA polymerase subunit sigma [Planctomycetaceae bacterium]|nr:RNA polymerase subunit sigma [Planctomycetaceae bacterium]